MPKFWNFPKNLKMNQLSKTFLQKTNRMKKFQIILVINILNFYREHHFIY